MSASGAPGASPGRAVRIVLVDDHEVVRAGLRMLLSGFGDLDVVGEAADGAQALDVVSDTDPDVVVMDLSMPGMDGVTATGRICAEHPEVRVLVLTTFADRDHVTAAIDAGALGYVLKDADPPTLAGAIRAAARGESPLDPRAARALLDRRRAGTDGGGGGTGAAQGQAAPDPGPAGVHQPGPAAAGPGSGGRGNPDLTARELEVLSLVGQGLSNRLIARRLGISEKTVKAHLTRVFSQVGVSDRVQAALWWQRHGTGP
jgi:DNA-binding NarL/FixJ family response regulator